MSVVAETTRIWHFLVLFMSPKFMFLTLQKETSVALKAGKCIVTLLLRVSPKWQHTLSLLFLCADAFIEIGFHLIVIHWFHDLGVGTWCMFRGFKWRWHFLLHWDWCILFLTNMYKVLFGVRFGRLSRVLTMSEGSLLNYSQINPTGVK